VDPRIDERRALLDCLLSASERLLVACTGQNIKTNEPVPLVTPLAVFTREPRSGSRFTLECWNDATTTGEIARQTGFSFSIADGAQAAPPITAREQQALAELAPQGQFAATVRG
jgi:acyl CoA:acetate/3-ketoacid CoA transferase beta subunit